MRLSIRTLATALAVTLLAAMLVAGLPGTDPEAEADLGPIEAVTVSAADFHPWIGGLNYQNQGMWLQAEYGQVARIPLPTNMAVRITNIKVRVLDDDPDNNMCISFGRAEPSDAASTLVGPQCTIGSNPTDPQTLTMQVFTNVTRFHTPYLFLVFEDSNADLRFYGATVFYREII